jgi:hypothetical protein
MKLIDRLFNKNQQCPQKQNVVSSIPKGWYVVEAGQNPLHMLWFLVLVNFDDVVNKVENPRHFVAEECDSFEQALQKCVKNII